MIPIDNYGVNKESNGCVNSIFGNDMLKFLVVLYFTGPCTVINICYVAIFIKIRKIRQEIQECLGGNVYKEEDLQLLKMMIIIFVAFFICFTPVAILNFILINDNSTKINPYVEGTALFVFKINFVINPFIYGFKNKVYRPAFISLFQKICQYICNIDSFSSPRDMVSGPTSAHVAYDGSNNLNSDVGTLTIRLPSTSSWILMVCTYVQIKLWNIKLFEYT